MGTMNYDSLFARADMRGKAREALAMQRTFANWGKERMTQMPTMATWPARQWIGTFLLEVTGIPWLVTATTLDLAAMPRHDPNKLLDPHERTTDDPPLRLPTWVVELTQVDVPGAAMIRFIDGVLQETDIHDAPPLLKLIPRRGWL